MDRDYTVLSKEEVASLLQCDPATIEIKARTGELPAVKIGRSWVFMRETLFAKLFELSLAPKESRENESVHARKIRGRDEFNRLMGRSPH